MKRYLADSNVALDLATFDPVWHSWSLRQMGLALMHGEVLVNPIIYAELAPAFGSEAELEQWITESEFSHIALPFSAAWPAAQAYKRYRRAGGTRISILPDFYIGAHAQVEGLTLITRDAARYRTYFPSVELIAPA